MEGKSNEQSPMGDMESLISKVLSRMDAIAEDTKATRAEITLLKANNSNLSTQFDSLSKEIKNNLATINNQLKECLDNNKQLKKENLALKKEIENLKTVCNSLTQESCSNTIKITNVPKVEGEILLDVIQKIFFKLGVAFEANNLDSYYRLRSKFNQKSPAIIIKFLRKQDKIDILRRFKQERDLLNSNIFDPATSNQIYINELMSPFNHFLLKK